MKDVTIYTDGSCLGNPGAGGWAAILIYNGYEKEISGGELRTTNNKMEMTAVIEALKCLKEPCNVTIYSDSKYVCNSVNLGWAKNWRANGWRNSNGKAKNIPLWSELLKLTDIHNVDLIWVKGHSGNEYNERCDKLAVAESKKQKSDTVSHAPEKYYL